MDLSDGEGAVLPQGCLESAHPKPLDQDGILLLFPLADLSVSMVTFTDATNRLLFRDRGHLHEKASIIIWQTFMRSSHIRQPIDPRGHMV